MRERRPSAAWVALGAIVVAVACCSSLSPRPQRLTLGIVDVPATGLVHVAKHSGFFQQAGLNVRFVSFTQEADALDALLDGRVDLATTFATPFAARALAGDTPRVLTTIHQSSRNTRIVVPKGRGIVGPEDLRGRRVGVPRGTNAEFFLDTLAARAGLDAPGDLREVDVRPQDAAAALRRREVDAVAVWYPWALCGHPPLESMECTELFADGYTEYSILVTRDEVIAARRDGLERFLRALSRAEALVVKWPDAAIPALRAELPDHGGAHLVEAWHRVTPQLGLDNLLLAVLDRESDWIEQRMNVPVRPVDFRALLYPDLLLEIEPTAVTLLGY
ncbi:MAG TPA: NrtA/SsuA/CpmA family ABC transporter substrate-binding protein [Anaeromyxobacteraceae bacterium]|nr:NrtA/SsuA/CpmA family ABC transporter substrate-binding protein [Anaeromyxobacteraceae bacterium]